MNPETEIWTEPETPTATKSVIFTMGGKGGTGKTTFLTSLAEWFRHHDVPCAYLDMDTENKTKGSFQHFFPADAGKINIHTREGLNAFLDVMDREEPIILADMGASSGQIAHEWFERVHADIAGMLKFVAVGMVTSEPSSVESVLSWGLALQDKVNYLVVLNENEADQRDFHYWDNVEEARKFREAFDPAVMRMESRIPGMQHAMSNHGATLGTVCRKEAQQGGLDKTPWVISAQGYQRRLFAEFDRIKEVLLP